MNKRHVTRAIAAGKLTFGTTEIDCYVLADGRRVLSHRGILRALGRGAKDGRLSRYIGRIPNAPAHLRVGPIVTFETPDGHAAFGREQSGSPAEFWARIATHFRKVPLQLPFGAHRTSDDSQPRVAG